MYLKIIPLQTHQPLKIHISQPPKENFSPGGLVIENTTTQKQHKYYPNHNKIKHSYLFLFNTFVFVVCFKSDAEKWRNQIRSSAQHPSSHIPHMTWENPSGYWISNMQHLTQHHKQFTDKLIWTPDISLLNYSQFLIWY